MHKDTLVSTLMMGRLVIVFLIAAAMLGVFLWKRRNRHPMRGQRERNIDEIRREGPTP